jgi:hypothetical protein
MGGPGIWDWGGAPRKKNNKDLNFVLKITASGDFLCRILVNFMLKSLLVEIFVV